MASLAEFLQAQNQLANRPTAIDYAQKGFETMAMPSALRMKQLEEQKAFEDYANTQKLRELFAQSKGMPDIASVGQYSPEMAIKLQQAQLENLAKQAQIQESGIRSRKGMQDIQAGKGQAFANAIGPHADQYFQDIQMGMSPGQALNKFKMMTGSSLNQLEQQGLSPDVPFDMNTLTPEAALRAASGHGYKSMFLQQQMQQQEEQFKRSLPPTPSAEQYYGGTHMTPQGPMRTPPVVAGGQSPFQVMESGTEGMQQAPMGQQDIDNLRTMYQNAPPGPDKERLGVMLADAIKQTLPSKAGTGGFVTPEQAAQMRIKEEEGKAEAHETAKLKAAGREDAETKIATILSMPSDAEIHKLLTKSMTGVPEAILKGPLSSALQIENEAQRATAILDVLHQNIKAIAEKAKGDLNAQEVRSFDAAVGALGNPDFTPETRFSAYLMAKNTVLEKTKLKHPEVYEQYADKISGKKTANTQPENSAIEEELAEAPSVKRGSKPKIGQIESGYMFKGGNPADPANWEKQ